jgi:hypothetical protein
MKRIMDRNLKELAAWPPPAGDLKTGSVPILFGTVVAEEVSEVVRGGARTCRLSL